MKKWLAVLMVASMSVQAAWAEASTTSASAEKTPATVIHLTEKSYSDAIKSEGVVLVDFWATWCPPCRVQGPILDELVKEVGAGVVIAKVDVDQNQSIAGAAKISSIPTMVIFKDGKEKDRLVGVHSKEQLLQVIKALQGRTLPVEASEE